MKRLLNSGQHLTKGLSTLLNSSQKRDEKVPQLCSKAHKRSLTSAQQLTKEMKWSINLELLHTLQKPDNKKIVGTSELSTAIVNLILKKKKTKSHQMR